ncbi:hypothetical protein ACKKBF_B32610 [Auxenochlorella protothecoides x Auxenochlorella symbiontica]
MAKLLALLMLCMLSSALAARTLHQSDDDGDGRYDGEDSAGRYEGGTRYGEGAAAKAPSAEAGSSRYGGGPSTSRYTGEESEDRYEESTTTRYDGENNGGRYEGGTRYGEGSKAPTSESRYGSSATTRYDGENDGGRYEGGTRYGAGAKAPTSESRYGNPTTTRYESEEEGGRYEGGARYEDDDERYDGQNNSGRYEGGAYGGRNSTSNVVRWTRGTNYTPLDVTVGDTITFQWSGGSPHDVATSPGPGVCTDLMPLVEAAESGSYPITFERPGTFTYACSVGEHCLEGQIVTVNVVAIS